MEVGTHGRSNLGTQFDAFLRKSVNYQKRNKCQNCMLLLMPAVVLLLLARMEAVADNLKREDDPGGPTEFEVPHPLDMPPALQIPSNQNRAIRTDSMPFEDLPSPYCRRFGRTCPVTFLFTGENQTLADGVAENIFPSAANITYDLAHLALGTEATPPTNYVDDSAFITSTNTSLYYIQRHCGRNSVIPVPQLPALCLQGLTLWRKRSSDISDELYKGFRNGNKENKSNEVAAAIDFLNTSGHDFNVILWMNKSESVRAQSPAGMMLGSSLTRLPRLVNLASNAYLHYVRGPNTHMLLDFIKEVPMHAPITGGSEGIIVDMIKPVIYMMLLLYIIPVLLRAIVYEKQHKLRMMMKMHGLGDKAYWMVTYVYDLVLCLMYMLIFLLAGMFTGLASFKENNYILQSLFFILCANWIVSFVLLLSAFLSDAKIAQVIGSVYQLMISLMGFAVLHQMINESSRALVILLELIPGFAIYRGLFELQRYSDFSTHGAGVGMQWKNLGDSANGMIGAMIILFVEWLIMLFLAYYVDQVGSTGSGSRKSLFFFLQTKNPSSSQSNMPRNTSLVFRQRENEDVAQEREKVEHLVEESCTGHAVVCHNVKKIYPARDGNPPKAAVKGMSLALPRAECFGMLGPNGAGKTSFLSMMIGLTEPTSGTAYIQGLDITTQMDDVYTCMGVCPQYDLLWETLTGREHLYFYGRLKNLKGSSLTQAVEDSLKGVDLLAVGDRLAGRYSGGMKRRLSVAISLIGDPKVVYLDEPSTGLDPASRNSLWNVVKRAKQDRAIILTTHSMEEAEALCDRLGIYVDGGLQCVGNSKELKARYGGFFVFTMTVPPDHDEDVEEMVVSLCGDAKKVYHLAGTQKFELPKQKVQLADVFQLVEDAKSKFVVQAWALADTTLEDVFIKVARQAKEAVDVAVAD